MPRSQVSDRRSCSGSVVIVDAKRVLHRDCAVAGERRPVLRARDRTVSILAWQVDQHRESGGALDQRPDRGTLEPDQQVAFPVPGNGTVGGLGRPFADHDLGRYVRPCLLAGSGSRNPECPSGAQARDELALERPAALHVESLVDRFVADPHRLIIGKVDPKPARDLLRAPALHPATITAMGLVLTVPRRPRRARTPTSGPRTRPTAAPARTRRAVRC